MMAGPGLIEMSVQAGSEAKIFLSSAVGRSHPLQKDVL
jgi:hypothetical protein